MRFTFFVPLQPKYIKYSTFAKEEVKEVKRVKEFKAICFIAKYTIKNAIGYNFYRPKGVITSLTTITSVHAKLQ